jgi:hypothetical protein
MKAKDTWFLVPFKSKKNSNSREGFIKPLFVIAFETQTTVLKEVIVKQEINKTNNWETTQKYC